MRRLASIRRIAAIDPISGADAIEVATVDGWKVVIKKDEFKVGDLCVYLEIDSWVPHELAPFLSKGSEPKDYEGVVGNRLRTVKLRGQVSQGLILPLSVIPENDIDWDNPFTVDVSPLLGVIKWEPTIPAQLAGQVKGGFPSFIPKTDQERIQNIGDEVFADPIRKLPFEVTLKLDGTSCTVYHNSGEQGVCSRNLELKISDENKDNSLVRIAQDSGLLLCLETIGKNVAVQGELMGPGIQGNREGLKETKLFIFDIFDIDSQTYLTPIRRIKFVERLHRLELNVQRVDHITVVDICRQPCQFGSVEAMLEYADGPSFKHPVREGLVWKCETDPSFSFKTISNRFLLKEKE